MTLTVQKRDRRYYILGNTFSIKGQLKSSGAKWDPDARAWYTGKRELAEKLAGQTGTEMLQEAQQTQAQDSQGLDRKVVGRAQYRGHQYYVVWTGPTSIGTGHGCKLCFRDGSKDFWAVYEEVQITKTYQTAKTIRSLQEYAQAAREGRDLGEEKAERTGRCRGCGGPLVDSRYNRAMNGYCGCCAFDEFDC